ncbi:MULTISPECIES: helix-turn-helix domain-containing protein [Burkholderia]|uniref:helix-turn-helix domain-containing protein n=1 Tax=Burkholderia TaxID=32008 RepID=UPI00075649F3|nr:MULTISPECIES: helix-turn-helix domain-containing protein [Burkholderia]AOJ73545.1 AraC family transcriptional regulator [Burkholderia savannae]KVG38912.1 AraC family transcriptional regulator [Burkholderia sp. MSMB0265]KVG81638.1 AraC family transcriptional regulator [Burkholderia sp. MSMB2040]KVG98795.1 AraC family transcriptional regulator [Burkholderia sp. MSMB2042]KVG98976.1 AraC family transcriptional regulator [Burkholderia sp. MSMB2041]
MAGRFGRFDCVAVSQGKSRLFSGPAIKLIKPVTECARLDAIFGDESCVVSIDLFRSALVVIPGDMKIISREGAWRFHEVPVFESAKLLAFLESCAKSDCGGREDWSGVSGGAVIYAPSDLSIWKFDRWLIAHVMGAERDADPLLAFLRAQESYGLVRFLLRERTKAQPVAVLAARYGVSESHFRRLCRRALGRGLKRELRQWRAAQAVLEIVESRESMTEVAMSNGFASSSHFSREIKDLFGISPCQFRRRT